MTQPDFDKQALKAALLTALDQEISAAIQSAREAQETASHEGNKPENKWDTLALEAAYLAHGQSERILKLQQQRIHLSKWRVPELTPDDVIRSGACVSVVCDDAERHIFIAPAGGHQISIEGTPVLVVSTETPLAKALMRQGEGDVVTLTLGGQFAQWEIVGVC